ncbi:Ig-like domain-containing protein [Leptospira ryugenii]|uniref:Ig-like domain-containing protein n=1 Tax=Leptospira ryugenii TaxID=1917863 RepID=UPI000D59696D|nr:Ig-like domain-containing protein [Leptospira ryugenii]
MKLRKRFFLLVCCCFVACNPWDISKVRSDYLLKLLSILLRDESPFVISSIFPKDTSTNNFRNTNILIGFSKNTGIFSEIQILSSNGEKVNGTFNYSGKYILFTPKEFLSPNTTFTIKIPKENGLESEFTSTFSTGTEIDITPPRVSSTSPEAGETGFPPNGTIIITFTEAIDPTSLAGNQFTISGNPTGNINLTDRTLAFVPSPNLASLTPFIVTLRTGVKDLAGNSMSDPYSWVFSTSSTPSSTCQYDFGIFNSCIFD